MVLGRGIEDDYGIAFHKMVAVYDYLNLYNTLMDKMQEYTNPKFRTWRYH